MHRKPSTEQISRKQTDGWHCINMTCNKMQITGEQRQCYAYTDSNANASRNSMVTFNNNSKINYYLLGPNKEANKRVSAKITKQLWSEFKDIFTGI